MAAHESDNERRRRSEQHHTSGQQLDGPKRADNIHRDWAILLEVRYVMVPRETRSDFVMPESTGHCLCHHRRRIETCV